MRKIIFFAAFFFLLVNVNPVYGSSQILARSGCCSHHGGVCGCGCCDGTGLSATCAPYYPECNSQPTPDPTPAPTYYAPAPTVPVYVPPPTADCSGITMSWTFTDNKDNSCNKDVAVKWNPCKDTTKYSLSLSQNVSLDPGPNSDTNNNNFTFTNIKPGKYFINLKPGNNSGWGKVYFWNDIEALKIQPKVDVWINQQDKILAYNTICTKSLTVEPSLGKIVDVKSGMLKIATDSATTYIIKSVGGDGEKYVTSATYEPPKETPTVEEAKPTPKENKTKKVSWFESLFSWFKKK